MNNIVFKTAEPAILPQVKRFFREHHFRPQAARSDDIHIALLDKRLIGALRLCPCGDDWLLRSMCIHKQYRQQGIGSLMLAQLQPVLQQRQCYCFPYEHLQSFYQRAGFILLAVDHAPVQIAEKYQGYVQRGKKILLMKHSS